MKKLSTLLLAGLTAQSFANFSSGNLVVTMLGDGTATSAATTYPITLRQYSTAGTQVGVDVPMPFTTAGQRITGQPDETSENQVTLSQDGRYLLVAGYADAPGVGQPGLFSDRMVARIPASGVVEFGRVLGIDQTDGDSFRAAISKDGNTIYTGTGTGGIDLFSWGSATGTKITDFPALDGDRTSVRALGFYGSDIFYTSSDDNVFGGQTLGNSFYQINGTPTSLVLANPLIGLAGSIRDFVFLTPTKVIISSSTNAFGLVRFELQSGVWVETGRTGATTGGMNNFIYKDGFFYGLRASGATLVKVPEDLSSSTVIATAPTNDIFRGIAESPSATTEVVVPVNLGDFDLDANKTLTAVVVDANGNVVDTTNGFVNFAGNLTVTTKAVSGSHKVYVRTGHWLQKASASFVANGASVTLPTVTLPNGDANGDNSIDLLDYFALSDSYNLSTGDAGFDANADFNEDGSVDLLDYFILSDNYNLAGDEIL